MTKVPAVAGARVAAATAPAPAGPSAAERAPDGPDRASGEGPGAGVLVVGCGNPLRGDDGAGPRVAELLAADPRLAGATVLARHQLTPELADAMREVSAVILVDADVGLLPGGIAVRTVDASAPAAGASSHHVDVAGLVALARELWGATPRVVCVAIGAAAFETGEPLSPEVERALPAAVEAVAGIVEEVRGA